MPVNVAALITNRRSPIGARGREKSRQTAQAVPDRTDTLAVFIAAQMKNGRLDVFDAEINIELSHQLERTVHVRFVPIIELHTRLEAPEQIRRECEVAVRRVAVGDRAHESVDTEDFLDDDDSGAARRSWNGEIPTERPVGGVYRDLLAAHRTAPAKMREL